MQISSLKATLGLAACLMAVPALNASTTINMTGCLARGPAAHEYTATDSNGQTFGLVAEQGTGVRMKKHVGQEVMITGHMVKGKRERSEAAKAGTAADVQYLHVNQIKEVSPSCQ